MRVVVNAAVSADGKIALRGGKPLRLSGPEDLARVHRLRAECDAILVGVGTVLADDPSLLVKAEHLGRAPARHPLRVVLDSRARSPPGARVFDGRARTAVVTAVDAPPGKWANAVVLRAGPVAGAAGGAAEPRVDLRQALLALRSLGVSSVLVEGGATVIGSFLRAGLVDEMTLYHAPVVVGGGAPSLVEGAGAEDAAHVLPLALAGVERLGDGVLTRWRPREGRP